MDLTLRSLGLVAGAALLSQCAPDAAKGKESYGGIAPGIAAPDSIAYLGQTYSVGYSAANKNGVVVEYYPAGEGPQQWTRMLALRHIDGQTSPQQQVASMAARMGSSGNSTQTSSHGATHEVDFTVTKNGKVEFNVYRYDPGTSGPGVKSVQYAAVVPKENFALGPGAMRALAEKHRKAVMGTSFPEVGRQ